jgi:hypothetical protein
LSAAEIVVPQVVPATSNQQPATSNQQPATSRQQPIDVTKNTIVAGAMYAFG